MATSTLITALNIYSPLIQAVSTVILVVVTIYYAIQSRRIVVETTKQRMDGSMPLIIAQEFDVSFTHGQDRCCVEADLKNIGKGPAFNVLIKFLDADTDQLVMSSDHYLPYLYHDQEDTLHIHLPKKEMSDLRFHQDKDGTLVAFLVCVIQFEDVYNRKIETRANFSYEKETSKMKPMLGDFKFSFVKR